MFVIKQDNFSERYLASARAITKHEHLVHVTCDVVLGHFGNKA